ncbi:MAG: alanine dehydrogenase [Methanobacteriaceae archaeon]|jgi:alanine dehydrogenase|nr:alanine dehydrogenase [Methanobacteriaceae archaeon]
MLETLLLKQSEIQELADMKEIIDYVETAYSVDANRKVQMPSKMYLFFNKYEGDLRIMPCFIRGLDEAGVKNVNVHPRNPQEHNLPTVMGLIELVDPQTGFPLAVMDGTWITNMRTGAAGGVATKYLARKDSKILGLVGAGMQAFTQAMAIKEVMDIKEVKVSCRTCTHRETFAKMVRDKLGLNARAVDTIQEAVEGSDVISTTTPSRTPIIHRSWVDDGTHINAMGADAPGKQELSSHLMEKSKIVIDCWSQASHSGEINIPVREGTVRKSDIHARIGEIVNGDKPGRESDGEITVFDSTGLAVQDIVTAWNIREKALKVGVGQTINFLE